MSNFYTAPPIYNTGGWGQRGDHPTFDPTGLVTVKETGFYYETKLEVFNFKNNCGYSMLLDDSSYHGLEYPVKRDGRTSLYVRYN